jgi:hypothetical protein
LCYEVGRQALKAPAEARSDRGWLLPQGSRPLPQGKGDWLFEGRRWLRDHSRLVVPETASKTNGRCHGDGESHKDAHVVSLISA